MEVEVLIPEAGSDLSEFDHCPRCNHGLVDHVEPRDTRRSERGLYCDNCNWVAIEHLPVMVISG